MAPMVPLKGREGEDGGECVGAPCLSMLRGNIVYVDQSARQRLGGALCLSMPRDNIVYVDQSVHQRLRWCLRANAYAGVYL